MNTRLDEPSRSSVMRGIRARWQVTAIDRIAPLLKEIASNTTAMTGKLAGQMAHFLGGLTHRPVSGNLPEPICREASLHWRFARSALGSHVFALVLNVLGKADRMFSQAPARGQ